MTDRQVDPCVHLILACLYTAYKTWNRYPHEIADIMKAVLELDRRKYEDDMREGDTK